VFCLHIERDVLALIVKIDCSRLIKRLTSHMAGLRSMAQGAAPADTAGLPAICGQEFGIVQDVLGLKLQRIRCTARWTGVKSRRLARRGVVFSCVFARMGFTIPLSPPQSPPRELDGGTDNAIRGGDYPRHRRGQRSQFAVRSPPGSIFRNVPVVVDDLVGSLLLLCPCPITLRVDLDNVESRDTVLVLEIW